MIMTGDCRTVDVGNINNALWKNLSPFLLVSNSDSISYNVVIFKYDNSAVDKMDIDE